MNAEEARKITGDIKGLKDFIYSKIKEKAQEGYSSVEIMGLDYFTHENLLDLLRDGYKLSYFVNDSGVDYLRIEWK